MQRLLQCPQGAAGHAQADGQFVVDALTPIADFNERFGADFDDDEYDTIGGLVAHRLGRVPRRDETVTIGSLRFKVMLTRGGAVRWFRVSRLGAGEAAAELD